jgi:hypothetical protein
LYSAPQRQSRYAETWYERAVGQINPSNTNYGAIWDHRKHELLDQFRNPYFRYGLAATLAIVVLFSTVFAQHVSHRRAIEIALQSIADIRRHDEYARQAAREAIRRYNDHIEKCNRMVEADESGLWKWISTAELRTMQHEIHRLNDALKTAREETDRVTGELELKSATMADMSLRSQKNVEESGQSSKGSAPPPHVQRINQLELELNLEKKKNQRLKGTALDARNS